MFCACDVMSVLSVKKKLKFTKKKEIKKKLKLQNVFFLVYFPLCKGQ